jgi:enamine deaminase RidA (YjgF/YER057c/UK114 family)
VSNKAINPPEFFDSLQHGFSQIVIAEGKRTAYFSGQVAWDASKQIVGKGDFAAQVEKSFENLRTAVHLAGGTMGNVAALRIYIVYAKLAEGEDVAVSNALKKFFPPSDAPPVSTWIGVYSLAHPDFLIEVEATAVLD